MKEITGQNDERRAVSIVETARAHHRQKEQKKNDDKNNKRSVISETMKEYRERNLGTKEQEGINRSSRTGQRSNDKQLILSSLSVILSCFSDKQALLI